MMGSRKIAAMAATSAVCLVAAMLTGCTTVPKAEQKADYSIALNKYYEGRPLCLWQDTVVFPVPNATPEQIDAMGLDTLADAGLLKATKADARGDQTFTLTDAGKAAFTPDVFKQGAGNFCYGRRKVASIDSTKRADSSSDLVSYHYNIPQPAAWATPGVAAGFPQMGAEITGTRAAQATLLATTEGWEVTGAPKALDPPAPGKVSKLKKLISRK